MDLRHGLALTVLGAGVSFGSHAASITYFLDNANSGPDGPNYLSVTLSDAAFGADANAIRFDVTALAPLTGSAGNNFGIQNFGFNTNLDPATVEAAIAGLPASWSTDTGQTQSGFGNFDVTLSGTGNSRQNPTLTFYVTNVAGDTLADYAALSTGTAGQGNVYFAAQVPGAGSASGWYGGPTTVIPLPPAAALLGSALGLMGWTLRRSR